VNEGAILAARRSKKKIGMAELQDAVERVALGGPERRSRVMSEREKLLVAYHEAGHAVSAAGMPKAFPVQKVTIVPRGRAGGYTLYLPEEENLRFTTISQYEAQLVSALGGRLAEEIVFGYNEVSNGASGDIQQVTRIARAMVTRFGMSQKLGPIAFGEREELIFLGREITEQRNYGDEIARDIDREVHRIVSEAYERTREILTVNRQVLNDMASQLIETETVDGEKLRELLGRVTKIDVTPGSIVNGAAHAQTATPELPTSLQA
jgi:cell division protease FtsH